MRIAVTYENDQVFQHFGHCQEFKIYDVENGEVVKCGIADASAFGHESTIGFLKTLGVDILICGGIGPGAQNVLLRNGIQFYGGTSGRADDVVAAFLKNELVYNPNVTCNHHDHDHDHDHGDGGCHCH